MYRTAAISDEISQDLKTACALAKQYSLDGLEIRSVEEKNPFQMSRTDFQRVREICRENELQICAVAAPFFKCDLHNRHEIDEHLEGLRRCAEAAHLWGTDLIRGFTFWRTQTPRENLLRIAEEFQTVIRIAEQEDIRIAIESEPSVCTENMTLLHEFLQMIPSARIGALYDAGNEVTDPACPAPYPFGYELLKDRIFHVHLKDTKSSPTGKDFYQPVLIGEGDVDYAGLIQRLKDDHYDKWVSVETHYRIRRAAFSTEELAAPQGSGFSAGGYEATEAYFKILRDQYNWQGR